MYEVKSARALVEGTAKRSLREASIALARLLGGPCAGSGLTEIVCGSNRLPGSSSRRPHWMVRARERSTASELLRRSRSSPSPPRWTTSSESTQSHEIRGIFRPLSGESQVRACLGVDDLLGVGCGRPGSSRREAREIYRLTIPFRLRCNESWPRYQHGASKQPAELAANQPATRARGWSSSARIGPSQRRRWRISGARRPSKRQQGTDARRCPKKMSQRVRSLAELDGLYPRFVEKDRAFEYVHRRRVESGAKVHGLAPVLPLPFDHRRRSLVGEPGRVHRCRRP